MCGIVGFFGLHIPEAETSSILNRMCASIIHRGPDDQGIYKDGPVGFGVRRLSIIDVAGGHQPVTNEGKNAWAILNGEIYNFAPLREELQKKGHRFLSGSDTEVIIHQYEEDGPACVHRFNGMFALAVWDQRSQSLFLARDRLGIKPLYYYWDGTRFLFASEIKALFASGLIEKDLDRTALWDYITLGYVPQPKTIWKNIHKLLPGHTLTIASQNPAPLIQRYWDIPYQNVAVEKTLEEYSGEFTKLFLDAVRLTLIADVPVGVLLSGGLDSSAVAAAVKEVHCARIDSFSVAFENSPETNELPYARQVAAWVGSSHHEVVISAKDFQDFLPHFVRYMDEPMSDLSSIPLYYVSRLAAQHVKAVVSGEGSDELLGGYDFDKVVRHWDWAQNFQRLPAGLRNVLVGGSRLLGSTLSTLAQKANTPIETALRTHPVVMTNLFSSSQKETLFKEAEGFEDSLDRFRHDLSRLPSIAPLHQVLYLYCQSWLVDDLLMKADRMTMANSLELRVPFLDHRLVEWLAKTPPWVKVGKDARGVYVTKRLLREFAKSRLPPEIISRPKQGFPVPVYSWLKRELKDWSFALLGSPESRAARWLDAKEIRRLVGLGTSEQGTPTDQQRLWQLLILELWLREWLP